MKRLTLLFATITIVATCLSGQAVSKADLKQLDEYYAGMVEDWDVPGLSIGIVKDGEMIFSGNYGVLEEGKEAGPDKNTLYAIASNSKAFTTAIIGMLVQDGKLDWNDKVKKYLPYFELYDPWVSNEVTVRDLLCHRVGLGTFSGDVIWYKSDLTAEEIIRRLKYLPQAFDFRSGYGYSNVMYATAGELIRKITGKTWSENVKERILEPLGMDRTLTTPDDLAAKGNYAIPHARENDINIPIAWENWESVGATGGIISSTADLSKWMIFNLDNGILGDDTLLTTETRNMVWTPHNNFIVDHTTQNDFNRHFNAYGLGWGLSDYHGHLKVGHTGAYDGMLSAVTLIPDADLGIVVLTNGMRSPYMAATYYALDMILGIEDRDWSSQYLEWANQRQDTDTRISSRKEKRVTGTNPSLDLEDYTGTYQSDIYGEIMITLESGQMRMEFEHSPYLSATLSHWHYDVWEIKWDNKHAWFSFGTVKFNLDNNLEVQGMDFDVPNNDIFFEELKPYRVERSKN
jgi:CubicO group peptidase (beta-lactamase class C family)